MFKSQEVAGLLQFSDSDKMKENKSPFLVVDDACAKVKGLHRFIMFVSPVVLFELSVCGSVSNSPGNISSSHSVLTTTPWFCSAFSSTALNKQTVKRN